MIRTTLAVAALAGSISTVLAGNLTEFALPTGTYAGVIRAFSNDGATILAVLPSFNEPTERPYHWRNGAWEAVPGELAWVGHSALSADGSAFVYTDLGENGGLFLRRGDQTTTIQSGPGGSFGAITRDGSAVFYARLTDHGPSVARWRDGVSTTLVELTGDSSDGLMVLAGDHHDRFIIATHRQWQPGTMRTALYDHGTLTEIPTVIGTPQFDSFVTAASADMSVIAGLEHGWGNPEPYPGGETAAWISRDGVTSELVIDGYDWLRVDSFSADGGLMLAQGMTIDGFGYTTFESLLIHEDGRVDPVVDLLAAEGVVLGLGDQIRADQLSANGMVLAGTITRHDAFGGPSSTMFTLRIPAPGATALLGFGAFFAARRRRA